jgi:hypothetical protein
VLIAVHFVRVLFLRGTNVINDELFSCVLQQEDLTGLGRIVLGLACNSALAVQSQNFNHAMDMVSRNYSPDLKNLIA